MEEEIAHDGYDDPSFDNVDEAVLDGAMIDENDDDEDNAMGASEHPDAMQYGMDVDMLLSLGVQLVDAIRYVRKCMRHTASVTFHEAYGRGGLTEMARKSRLDIEGLRTLDFACEKENGDHWDFTRSADRDEAMALLEKDDPDWVIGSPPCTAFFSS